MNKESVKEQENSIVNGEKEKNTEKHSTKTGITGFILIIVIVCIILGIVYFIITKRSSVVFDLRGDPELVLEVGNVYKEEGVIATVSGNNVNNKVSIRTNLNTNIVGKYIVEYNLKLITLGINDNLYRTVIIQDTTKPELTINSEKEITVYQGDEFTVPTCTAIDNYDGDISNKVTVNSNVDTSQNGTYEINYTVKDINNNETTDKIIVYVKAKKNPYIVVSISKQTLEYYEYDSLVLSSNIVTGINGKTPTGTFKILNKATNIILRGEDYESFVNYWMAFKGSSFGFHDASWRSKFGGTIYKTNGSHGCVNMPYNKVKQLYNMVSVGTPVYIKY